MIVPKEMAAEMLRRIRECPGVPGFAKGGIVSTPPAARSLPFGLPGVTILPGSLAVGDAVRLRHEGSWPATTATLRTDDECDHAYPDVRNVMGKRVCRKCPA